MHHVHLSDSAHRYLPPTLTRYETSRTLSYAAVSFLPKTLTWLHARIDFNIKYDHSVEASQFSTRNIFPPQLRNLNLCHYFASDSHPMPRSLTYLIANECVPFDMGMTHLQKLECVCSSEGQITEMFENFPDRLQHLKLEYKPTNFQQQQHVHRPKSTVEWCLNIDMISALPRALKSLQLFDMIIYNYAIEYLPPNLELLEMSSVNVDFDDHHLSLLPRTLKHLDMYGCCKLSPAMTNHLPPNLTFLKMFSPQKCRLSKLPQSLIHLHWHVAVVDIALARSLPRQLQTLVLSATYVDHNALPFIPYVGNFELNGYIRCIPYHCYVNLGTRMYNFREMKRVYQSHAHCVDHPRCMAIPL
jgi:hypothetical protein